MISLSQENKALRSEPGGAEKKAKKKKSTGSAALKEIKARARRKATATATKYIGTTKFKPFKGEENAEQSKEPEEDEDVELEQTREEVNLTFPHSASFEVDEKFRLWVAAGAEQSLPTYLLTSSNKIVIESAKGLRQ
jgi:hypothetical protein